MDHHDFSEGKKIEKTSNGDVVYYRCKRCKQIMFEEDPFFNLICYAGVTEMESLRQKIMNKNHDT